MIVLAVAAAAKIVVQELLVTGKNFRYILAHEIDASLGPDKSLAQPFFMPIVQFQPREEDSLGHLQGFQRSHHNLQVCPLD